MKTVFPSLNLAQAVMLYAWELSKITESSISHQPLKSEESFHSLVQKVRSILIETGFDEQSAIFPRFLERIAFLDESEHSPASTPFAINFQKTKNNFCQTPYLSKLLINRHKIDSSMKFFLISCVYKFKEVIAASAPSHT